MTDVVNFLVARQSSLEALNLAGAGIKDALRALGGPESPPSGASFEIDDEWELK